MNENHVLNESLKRLEPLSKQCEYCLGKAEVTSVNDSHFASVYKVKDRTNIIVYNSVEFSELKIGIPRCTTCLKIHESASLRAKIVVWLGCILICLGGGILIFGFLGGFIGLILTIFLGIILPIFLEDVYIKRKNILTLNEGTNKNDTIRDFVVSGWSLTPPSA